MPDPRFHRTAETHRKKVRIRVDGRNLEALEGDTVLTALMMHEGAVRAGEYGEKDRGGFCVMGACQDCWVTTVEGARIRSCTTYVREGLDIMTGRNRSDAKDNPDD